MRDYMERRVTSPTWGPSPPCKQALISRNGELIRERIRQRQVFAFPCCNRSCILAFVIIDSQSIRDEPYYQPHSWGIIALDVLHFRRKPTHSNIYLPLVVRKVDNAIHRINHYPTDNVFVLLKLIRWIAIYSVDSVIQPLNNWGQVIMLIHTEIPRTFTSFSLWTARNFYVMPAQARI